MKYFVICAALLLSTLFATNNDLISVSDNYDGKHFRNIPETKAKTFADVVRWRLSRNAPAELDISVSTGSGKPSAKNESDEVAVTFVGHATFLIQAKGINVLTDPIWSDRCSPISFIGPKRLREPGVAFDDLPKIDAVVVSHNHYDHMDLPTLLRLWQRDRPLFIVPLKNREKLKDAGIDNIVEHDWWQSTSLNQGLTVTAVPAKHWSGRWIFDRNEALWAGYVLSFEKKHVFFAGDTGFGPHFSQIKERFPEIEIALLPIGAYLPRWFMSDHHLSPDDALKAAKILSARFNIPMHFGTFSLGDDGYFGAKKELKNLLTAEHTKFTFLSDGEQWRASVMAVAAQ